MRGASHGSGLGCGGPAALVHPAEDHQIGLLQPRFEQAPDRNSRVAAIGTAHRDRVEQFGSAAAAHRRRRAISAWRGGRLFELGDQFGRLAPVGAAPRARRRRALRPRREGRARGRRGCRSRSSPRASLRPPGAGAPRRGRRVRDRSGADRSSQCARRGRRARRAGAGRASARSKSRVASSQSRRSSPSPADQRMLEQGERGDRRKVLGHRGGEPEQQRSGGALRQAAGRRCRRPRSPSARGAPTTRAASMRSGVTSAAVCPAFRALRAAPARSPALRSRRRRIRRSGSRSGGARAAAARSICR